MPTSIVTAAFDPLPEPPATRLARLAGAARRAIGQGSAALAPIGTDRQAAALLRFVAAGAWTDAALALLRLEAPNWQVSRLEIDDGEWFCRLSRYPSLPADFDETAEGRDQIAAGAILAALDALADLPPQAARRISRDTMPGEPAWVDNFR